MLHLIAVFNHKQMAVTQSWNVVCALLLCDILLPSDCVLIFVLFILILLVE